MSDSKLRLGVIGLGAMGQHHARLYSKMSEAQKEGNSSNLSSPIKREGSGDNETALVVKNQAPDVELVAVADSDAARAREIGVKYDVLYYNDYHDLLGRVDAVSIAVPTTLHHKVAMDFLNAGVHCLVEKPIASTLEEAEEMIAAAEKNRVKLAVGHIERFNPAVIKLKEVIDRGTLGKLLIISTRRVGPYVPRIRDVGVIIDSATHDIGVVNYLLGKTPVSIHAKTGQLIHSKEDHALILLDYGDTAASIEVNWFTPHKVRTLVASGSEGIAYLDYIEQTLSVHNSHNPKAELISQTPKIEPLKIELEDYIDSIIHNRPPAVGGIEAIEILRIAVAATQNP